MSDIFDLQAAARYLGVKPETVKHHLYVAKDLQADGTVGKSLYFTRETLDTYQANRRGPGRPAAAPKDE